MDVKELQCVTKIQAKYSCPYHKTRGNRHKDNTKEYSECIKFVPLL